ncbi:aminotransferase class V-fold PLP-dependent enzyme [Conexibacter arvalis]|uniref:L-cysteine/cystine lyase n=1 Tax=Conexibacter arvalis TaxID=912552 RepID=A0A840IFE7_9ACTN|nr:aminotransferase class V-fold PLP-dependent enzyme [Conexibacter arvalis]MBB4662718.1 L-cysteine/cystine lyase [Conexibacter arvalis]
MGTSALGPLEELRAQFPVCERVAYLNAGTNGPVATRATEAARAQLEREQEDGRGGMPFFVAMGEQGERLRALYAARLGAAPADVALTTSTTDGIARALLALDLRPGEEILTSDEEHPGVYGPLTAQRRRGVEVRTAPFADLADAVGPRTRLVVCSHVSWRSGQLAPSALREIDPPLLLDGAQGVGAVPIDVAALGADMYAGSGQKWLCGPCGLGMLYLSPAIRERLAPPSPGYVNLADAGAGLDAIPADGGCAYDTPALPPASLVHAAATLELLEETGWERVHAQAHDLADLAAALLRERGREVLARDRTTLVTWRERDAERRVERLLEAGVVVRSLPGEELLRASFGGWSSVQDLERLLEALPKH